MLERFFLFYTGLPSLLSTPEKAPGWKYKTATRYSSFLAPLGIEEMELLQCNLVLHSNYFVKSITVPSEVVILTGPMVGTK